jgi:hypothetical protein
MEPMSTMADLMIILKNGRMTDRRIYSEYRKLKHDKVVPSYQAEIRNTLQRGCPERPEWNGKDRVFRQIGRGVWSLRE